MDREVLLKHFRAHLHLAITARQTGQDQELKAMPGPRIQDYCRALAKLPDNTLAGELWHPVRAILEQIDEATLYCRRRLIHKQVKDAAEQAELERVLWQLDFALALIMRMLPHQVCRRAELTDCGDLLCDVICHMAIGTGLNAADLIRRYLKLNPEEGRSKDGSITDGGFPDSYTWDVYQRVEALDKLADEFPDHIRHAARRMHAWPMLMHRHTNNRRRFQQLAKRFELGIEYPTDASEGARFRPDTPMVRYLDPFIFRLHSFYCDSADLKFESPEGETERIGRFWRQWPEDLPEEDILQVLRAVRRLPPLTKAAASQWAEKAVVPLILATDARDWKNCADPALQAVAKQKGVKSRATFKSRLLSAVSATLRRLARPA